MSRAGIIEGTLGQLVGNDLYIGSVERATHYPFLYEYTTIDGEKVLDHPARGDRPAHRLREPYKKLWRRR